MNYQFKLIIGDSSGDGHEITEDYTFKSNVPVKEVEQAYLNSCKITGTGIDSKNSNRTFLSNYEHNSVTEEQLIELGVNLSNYNEEIYNDSIHFNGMLLARLFKEFIITHNPHIQLEEREDNLPIFGNKDIGMIGYGVFGD